MEFPYNLLRYLIFIFIIRCFINAFKKEKPVEPIKKESPKIVYYVNQKRVEPSHLVYYFDVLGLTGSMGIDDDVIKKAVAYKLGVIETNEGDVISCAKQDILAAGYYVLDNWNYHVMLN